MHSGLEIQVQHLRELARASGSDVKFCKMFLSFFCHWFFLSCNSTGRKLEFSNNYSTLFYSRQSRRCPWMLSCLQKQILNDQSRANTVDFYACLHLFELLNWHFHWSICEASICSVTQEQQSVTVVTRCHPAFQIQTQASETRQRKRLLRFCSVEVRSELPNLLKSHFLMHVSTEAAESGYKVKSKGWKS